MIAADGVIEARVAQVVKHAPVRISHADQAAASVGGSVSILQGGGGVGLLAVRDGQLAQLGTGGDVGVVEDFDFEVVGAGGHERALHVGSLSRFTLLINDSRPFFLSPTLFLVRPFFLSLVLFLVPDPFSCPDRRAGPHGLHAGEPVGQAAAG